MNIQAYNKLIAAIVVPTIMTAVSSIGITPEMPFQDALTFALTAFFVWLVPNKK